MLLLALAGVGSVGSVGFGQNAPTVVAPVVMQTPEGLLDVRALKARLGEALRGLGYQPLGPSARPAGEAFVWPYPKLRSDGVLPRPLGATRYLQPTVCAMAGRIAVFVERGTVAEQLADGVTYRFLSSKPTIGDVVAATTSLIRGAPRQPASSSSLRIRLTAAPASPQGVCWNLAFMAAAAAGEVPARFASSTGGAFRQQVIRASGAERQVIARAHFHTMAFWQVMKGSKKGVTGRLTAQSAINGQNVTLSAYDTNSDMSKLQATIRLVSKSTDTRVQVMYPSSWLSFLQLESRRLVPSDPPRIVARRGRWAYLDRGRSYGITMKQRFVGMQRGSSRNSPVFAGHVVKFFGFSEGLTDAQGHPITDGAIIFLRSGQGKAVIGSPIFPDQATFP